MGPEERSFYATVLIVSIVLGMIITYFIVSIIRQQRRSLRLYQENIRKEITTLEIERTRMAADLHDELGPILSSVKLRVGSLDVSKEDETEVKEATDKMDDLIIRMREITFDLMPTSLINKGLTTAVSEFIESCSKKSKLTIKFKHENISLPQEQSINLYRIIQEIIHNTIKHAQATEILIELRRNKNNYVLLTKDNGTGFRYNNTVKKSPGRGLHNLLSRTEVLGGKMFVESKKNKGTTYLFEIPIAKNGVKTNPDNPGR
jgi:signal transduction histidine kinase